MSGTTPTATPGVPSGVALLGMLQLTDSALPTGAFSHSLGLETYMSDGRVEGEEDFAAWLEMFVEQQLTFTDALAVRLVYAAENFDAVADLDELVTAQALPAQIREAGRTMGRRLLRIGAPAYPGDWVRRYHEGVEAGTLDAHQALVWGVIAREIGVPVEEAVAAHLYASVMSLTQNAVRGIPLGQDAGQRVVRRAQEWVLRAVEVSRGLHPDDLDHVMPEFDDHVLDMHGGDGLILDDQDAERTIGPLLRSAGNGIRGIHRPAPGTVVGTGAVQALHPP